MTDRDRIVLAGVLTYHFRKSIEGCSCGWSELGRSWPEHVATMYEQALKERSEAKIRDELLAQLAQLEGLSDQQIGTLVTAVEHTRLFGLAILIRHQDDSFHLDNPMAWARAKS